MVNLQAFVNTIHNFSANNVNPTLALKELASFCRTWLDECSDKISLPDTDRLLALINIESHSLAVVTVMLIKLTKLKSETDFSEFLKNLQNQIPRLVTEQLKWAPDIYNRLFENITEHLLKKNLPLWGIPLLKDAILAYTGGHPEHLTGLHSSFLCLCLKAKHFEHVLPFLHVDVIELFKNSTDANGSIGTNVGFSSTESGANGVSSSEGSSQSQHQPFPNVGIASLIQKAMSSVSGSLGLKSDEPRPLQPILKRRVVLLYFYYGGMIFAALERWAESVLFFEHAICLPIKKSSAIVLEALKKYIIIWLIMGRKKPIESLPSYRSPSIQRNFVSLAAIYMKLANIMQPKYKDNKVDVVKSLTAYFEEKHAFFARDQNAGLVKVLIKVYRENSVARLGNIFVSLQLNDVARLAHMPHESERELEKLILRLRQSGQLIARIDDQTKTVIFEEDEKNNCNDGPTKVNENGLQLELDTAMEQVIVLSRIIRSFDDTVRLNPSYIEKIMHKGKERATGPVTGSSSGSGPIFPEDEGFFLTGSP